ncbi:MAG TPA: carbamoyltransferase [Flavobacteriales bacterium]|nr:carbamoyltransferase [Flavobacteriales bacterium]
MYILGINAFHADSSACLMRDGEVVNAIEEERIRRVKHWAGFPIEAIKFCLKDEGISIHDVDHITISRDPSANIVNKVAHTFKNLVKFSSIYDRLVNSRKVASIKSILAGELGVTEDSIRAEVHNVEHHRSHMGSAFFASPFDESAILSVDGFGDFTSTMIGIGKGNKIEVLDSVLYPHSLGVFYTAFTQFLGFHHYGDEYKVMGLAAYGEPKFVSELEDIISETSNGLFKLNEKYFRHPKEGVTMVWENGIPDIGTLFSDYWIEKLGSARAKGEEVTERHMNMASSMQKLCENTIFRMLNHLHAVTGMDNLCLTGGVAQNSVANGKILENTAFSSLYVPSAGHDAGTSIGSALYFYNNELGMDRIEPMYSGALGSIYTAEEIERVLIDLKLNYKSYSDDNLYDEVSNGIIRGGVIGWFQGRAEFGPRALGNRSILVDPRRDDAKELLNKKIKKRESFRPFAPSILKEHVVDFFEENDEVPFMEKVFVIREERRKEIPAVTHVDGTGRLQTVDATVNARYYRLISAFMDKTGIPILLNTSFNENEPIVNAPKEAIDCFLRTDMDMLVLENFIVTR